MTIDKCEACKAKMKHEKYMLVAVTSAISSITSVIATVLVSI